MENKEVTRRILHDPVSYSDRFSAAARAACEGLLAKDSSARLGFRDNDCSQLKAHPLFATINWGRLEAGNPHGDKTGGQWVGGLWEWGAGGRRVVKK